MDYLVLFVFVVGVVWLGRLAVRNVKRREAPPVRAKQPRRKRR